MKRSDLLTRPLAIFTQTRKGNGCGDQTELKVWGDVVDGLWFTIIKRCRTSRKEPLRPVRYAGLTGNGGFEVNSATECVLILTVQYASRVSLTALGRVSVGSGACRGRGAFFSAEKLSSRFRV